MIDATDPVKVAATLEVELADLARLLAEQGRLLGQVTDRVNELWEMVWQIREGSR